MSQACEICSKHPVAGRSISHSHRVTNRTFRRTFRKVSAVVDGKSRKMNECHFLHEGRLRSSAAKARQLHKRPASAGFVCKSTL